MPDTATSTGVARELFLRTFLVGSPGGDAVRRLAEAMRDVRVARGETFFHLGDPPDHTYFVVDGEVQLLADGQEPWTFGRRSVVGSIDLMADRPRTRSAVALVDTHLLSLRREDWYDVLEDHFDFTQATLLTMARGITEAHLGAPPDGLFPQPGPPVAVGRDGPLDRVARMLALRRAPVFALAGVQVIASVAAAVTQLRLSPGDTIFDVATEPGALFFIVHGLVDVDFIKASVTAVFGPGDLVGSTSAFGGGRAAARAVAREPTLLLRLREEDYFDQMEEHFDLARSAMAYMSLDREAFLVLRGQRAQEERASRVEPSNG